MTCQEIQLEIEAYAINALPAEEMYEIEQHLKNCEACQQAVEAYNSTLEAMLFEAAEPKDFEPALGHKDRFLKKLESHPQLRSGSLSNEALTGKSMSTLTQPATLLPNKSASSKGKSIWSVLVPRLKFNFGVIAVGLLFVISLGLGLTALNLNNELAFQKNEYANINSQLQQAQNLGNQLNQQLQQAQLNATTLNSQLNQQIKELATLRNQVNQQQNQTQLYQTVSMLLNENGATTRQAETKSNQATLNILMAPQDKQLALFVKGFPQLKSNETYQLWLYKGNQVVRGSTFNLMNTSLPDGTVVLTLQAPEQMQNYTALLITIEPLDNSSPNPSPDKEVIRDNLAA